MSRDEWISQALEDAPEITPDEAATLADLLADARRSDRPTQLLKEAS